MQDKQDKKKKTDIKVRDLKPSKDAKGGSRGADRPGRGDGPGASKPQADRFI